MLTMCSRVLLHHWRCQVPGGTQSEPSLFVLIWSRFLQITQAKDLTKRNGKKDTGLFDHIKDAIAQNVMGMRERQVKNSVTPEDYAAVSLRNG